METSRKKRFVGDARRMILTVDDKRRVTLPRSIAGPADVFAIEFAGPGRLVLTRREKTTHAVKLRRKGQILVASTGRPITMAQTRTLLDQFP